LWETVQYLCVLCVELVSGSSKVSDSSKVSESKVSEKNECCVCVCVCLCLLRRKGEKAMCSTSCYNVKQHTINML